MSGRENLRITANVKGVGRAAIDQALDLVGLADRQADLTLQTLAQPGRQLHGVNFREKIGKSSFQGQQRHQ